MKQDGSSESTKVVMQYEIGRDSRVEMPIGAQVLHAGEQFGSVFFCGRW